MRTNIVIDDDLMKRAMRACGAKTKREAVEAALRLMVSIKAQERIRRLRGKLKWEGDLEAMRRDRFAQE
jgi:Arc/MetJ family transcription regulator